MVNVRQVMTPVSMNQFAFSGTTPIGAVAPAAGADYAGTNTTFTSWGTLPAFAGGPVLGINYANNGSQWLWYYNGATPTSAYVLIGVKAGGLVQQYTQYTTTIAATTYGFLGPFSPASFNQQDSTQFLAGGAGGTAPGGIIDGGLGLTCIDFLNTTTLAVRLYQCGTVSP
jgi:hypothetical protein